MNKTWAEEMVYKYHKEIQKLTKERNQLEQQLAESEEEKETLRISQSSTHNTLMQVNDELLKTKQKLAEAQKTIEIQAKVNDALISENLDYSYDITDTAYEKAKYMAESWEEDYQQEIAKLKQQLAEHNEYFKSLSCKDFNEFKDFISSQHEDKGE